MGRALRRVRGVAAARLARCRVRLWTLHPKYLDTRGLTALWREGLLARAVLGGATRGYRHHPQLERFRRQPRPVRAMNAYLRAVLLEAQARGYRFDGTKLGPGDRGIAMRATRGQLSFEWQHLLRKLRSRSPELYRLRRRVDRVEPHPLFRIVAGSAESWERKRPRARRRSSSH